MPKRKVLVALSGGVDSSVAALLALQEGCEVVAATLDMTPSDPELRAAWSCGVNARETIDSIVQKLGIRHHYLSCYQLFRQNVLRRCFAEYASGRTPNPCCFCNPLLKFGLLLDFAAQIGAEKLLTGHYAKMTPEHLIERGDDPAKDQSYFLYRLTREQLSRIEFPVGFMQKSEVRRLAEEHRLPSAATPDSQDACFHFPGESFATTLFRLFHGTPKPGDFLYQNRKVGRHDGIHNFTVGQRKGLGVALGIPGYVKSIAPESGQVELVTDQAELDRKTFHVAELNWQCGKIPRPDETLQIQIRYRTRPVPGKIECLLSGTAAKVNSEQPLRAVTPGQSAVFYRGKILLGGGIITDFREGTENP